MTTARNALKKLPHLQRIKFGSLEWNEDMADFAEHPEVCEISYSSRFMGFDIPEKFRFDLKVEGGFRLRQIDPDPLYNFSPEELPFIQQEPKILEYSNKTYHCGGIINSVIVLGATDGTLTFLTVDTVTKQLNLHSHYNGHNDCINHIWNQQCMFTYVASSVRLTMSLFSYQYVNVGWDSYSVVVRRCSTNFATNFFIPRIDLICLRVRKPVSFSS